MTHFPKRLPSDGPDFIGLGGRRCGSSKLHELLNAHPEVTKPKGGAHFFSDNYAPEGFSDLSAMFVRTTDNKARIDLSVSYLYPEYAALVATRIGLHRADANLFVLLRDPVDRSYSDYLRSVKMLEIDPQTGFIEACRKFPELIERSKYHARLSPFWERFGTERVKIFILEEMMQDRVAYFADMAEFFGIAVEPFLAESHEKKGHAHSVKSPLLQKMIFGGKSALRKSAKAIGMADPWDRATRHLQPVYQRVLAANARERKIAPEELSHARQALCEDASRLDEATNKDLRALWKTTFGPEKRAKEGLDAD